jgi:hypothetical protein
VTEKLEELTGFPVVDDDPSPDVAGQSRDAVNLGSRFERDQSSGSVCDGHSWD